LRNLFNNIAPPPCTRKLQALCGPATRVLVTYEPRLPEVRAALVGAAQARFGAAFRALSAADLPENWAPSHIEAFEMHLLP
jgi:ABC-type enterobactin transport system permease subunit